MITVSKIITKSAALCLFTITLITSTAAQADLLYLQCGTTLLVIDLTGKTASGAYPGAPPAPAIITPVSIDFTAPGEAAHNDYQIDRSAGTLTVTTVQESNGFRFVSQRATCTQVAAPQTKF